MIKSPCIGICTIVSNECIGCKRKSFEISNWIFYDEEERNEITDRCIKEMEKALKKSR